MPPLEHLVELRVAVKRAERRQAESAAGHITVSPEDLRTQAIGELLDAIDRIDPGLGTRLLLAMYPTAHAMNEVPHDRRRAA